MKSQNCANLCRVLLVSLSVLAFDVQAGPLMFLTNRLPAAMSDLPRYEKLPLFYPHRKSFTCVYQDQHVPPIDPQAELWFQPISYRWATNLKSYSSAKEPERFSRYYESMASGSALIVIRAAPAQ